jgi:hypothetical protein
MGITPFYRPKPSDTREVANLRKELEVAIEDATKETICPPMPEEPFMFEKPKVRPCLQCKREFEPAGRYYQVYCSYRCGNQYRTKRYRAKLVKTLKEREGLKEEIEWLNNNPNGRLITPVGIMGKKDDKYGDD